MSTWDLAIPASGSLKRKRAVIRALKDRLARMNVSVVESGLQDMRNRARISVAFLAAHAAQADAIQEFHSTLDSVPNGRLRGQGGDKNVLEGTALREQVVQLKDESDPPAAERAEVCFSGTREVVPE